MIHGLIKVVITGLALIGALCLIFGSLVAIAHTHDYNTAQVVTVDGLVLLCYAGAVGVGYAFYLDVRDA